MELLFITLGGALLGIAARYAIPRRSMHGVLVVPAVGAAVAAVVWVALTWLGLAWDGGWIWVISLVASGLAAAAVALFLGPRRERDDAETFTRLAKAGVARS
ncbi:MULTISPECIES: hypothetical protein [Agromyces]|jgi:hypothetical protein|uniref:Integral membrane protein n=1 Tax=Agromyces indicus TaxID=758919 RepID=A0ABU1FJ65_9MICO|nr:MULTISPECIES: hypothetical protein [Agromyces]KZE92770.1 hypothetical protein AVP42_02205 [Agromyces sp. NDB4Y10]MCK8608949.1 hypothetical protein [Agromyces sp. C10]MDR5691809.1 hypothetical protein [Agromyces indicus]